MKLNVSDEVMRQQNVGALYDMQHGKHAAEKRDRAFINCDQTVGKTTDKDGLLEHSAAVCT